MAARAISIRTAPANRAHFARLKQFARRIIAVCEEQKITPVVWGGLAFFGYTRDRKYAIRDIDFLIPDKSMKKMRAALAKRKIRHRYIRDWHSVVASKGDLRVEMDPIEWYLKGPKKYNEFDFDGLAVKVVRLKSLKKMYERAAQVSKDKPQQHHKRFEELKRKSHNTHT